MRTINANALAYVDKQYASEPANIVEFDFGIYCDKDISQAPGKILEISRLDAIINVSKSSDSQELTVVLDDTDGTIKEYMESNDIHLTTATVYQWFDGLDYSDRFILFQGQINSPVSWNEGERTVKLTIISKIEDVEVGFSPEEGQFTKLSNDYAGKPWPMCFGTVNAVRALRLNSRYKGMTAEGFGFSDLHLEQRGSLLGWFSTHPGFTFTPDQFNGPLQGSSQVKEKIDEQKATRRSGVNIFNGEKFPRGDLVLDFGRVQMNGHFEGHYFKFHPGLQGGFYTYGMDVGIRPVNDLCEGKQTIESVSILSGFDVQYGVNYPEGQRTVPDLWLAAGKIIGENCGYVYISPGSTVRIDSDEAIYYAVSCVPGTIQQVSSFISAKGDEFLQNVPDNLWHQENWDLGNGLTGVVLVIHDALSKQINPETGNSWSDELYVTFKSTVGPNTADVLYYLTTTYANKGIESYAAVRAKINNYPSDFAMYDRPNIVDALSDIAWQARCSIHYKNGAFYLNYLPDDQTSRDIITTADILENTLSIEYTETEDIVTKMDCIWSESAIQEFDNKVILRNNISKYGTKDKEYDYYIYNYIDAVLKSGTYWLVKYSNTWKRVQFETPITKLALETLDYITLNLDALANETVICSIEEVTYNSDNHSLVFTCFAPVKAGKMEEYIYAYPANLSVSLTYPSEDEFDVWQSSDAIGKLTSGNLELTSVTYYGNLFSRANPDPYNNSNPIGTQFKLNGYSDIDRRWSDRGNLFVSDGNDNHPGVVRLKSTPILGVAAPGPDSENTGTEDYSVRQC